MAAPQTPRDLAADERAVRSAYVRRERARRSARRRAALTRLALGVVPHPRQAR